MRFHLREQIALIASLVKWCILGVAVGVCSGLASAAFLIGLHWATQTRETTPWLLWLLPFAGMAIGFVYSRVGKEVEGGNNLLLERIHRAEGDISWRMGPLIAISTIGTHLFGGSAGREGTAVQMGGSLADLLARLLRLSPRDRRMLLMSGISGGFGAVFGTPVAGAVFGLEVLAIGRIRYDAIVPCFVASAIGDLVCRGVGIDHHLYDVSIVPIVTPALLLWTALAGCCFGMASLVFAELTHAVTHLAKNAIQTPWLRPAFGGVAVIGLTFLVGNRDYLGLGLPLIEQSFGPGGVFGGAFALKILFTAVTLGTGFKGGEVTPLFCIGATLGCAFGAVTGQSTEVFAALGFVAVFAGAANTPLACILMGIELFGAGLAVPLMLACIVSYITSGHRGIYMSQQVDTPKVTTVLVPDGLSLRDAHSGGLEVETAVLVRFGKGQFRTRNALEDKDMSNARPFGSKPLGQLRIFLHSDDKLPADGWKERLHNQPIYLRILKKAQEFGLTHGTVKQCVSGFYDEDQTRRDLPGHRNTRLPIYVELHGSRERLEQFCRESSDLLRGGMIVYKDVERWGWHEEMTQHLPIDRAENAPDFE
jgi:H+/Cl- antiporter ClcA/PII-like signaling protein